MEKELKLIELEIELFGTPLITIGNPYHTLFIKTLKEYLGIKWWHINRDFRDELDNLTPEAKKYLIFNKEVFLKWN